MPVHVISNLRGVAGEDFFEALKRHVIRLFARGRIGSLAHDLDDETALSLAQQALKRTLVVLTAPAYPGEPEVVEAPEYFRGRDVLAKQVRDAFLAAGLHPHALRDYLTR